MSRFQKSFFFPFVAALMLYANSALGQAPPPRLFFTDLTSAPNTGGESVGSTAGAYITLYGNFFGSSQGSASVAWSGAPNCNTSTASGIRVVGATGSYTGWGMKHLWYQKIIIQIGTSCTAGSGNLTVTTSAGTSNGIPFTVRPGTIRCVQAGTGGTGTGTYPNCYRSSAIVSCKNAMVAGDICYVGDGVSAPASEDNYNGVIFIGSSGTAANPYALVAAPGATATVSAGSRFSVRFIGGAYWTIGGLTLISNNQAVETSPSNNHLRFIANTMSCPGGSGQAACFHTDTTATTSFFGNYVHHVATAQTSIDKYYHAVYFTTNSNGVDVGWNEIAPNPDRAAATACRALQAYSTGGSDEYDYHIHDNFIHDTACDGINLATMNTDAGTVEVYNNVVWHVGTGPDPYNGSSNYSCLFDGTSGSHTTPVEVYNNTFVDCSSRGGNDSGAIAPAMPTRLRNNVIYQLSGEHYKAPNWSAALSGSNNDWYGSTDSVPSGMTANLTVNPQFIDTSVQNFHLQAGSPLINAGVAISGLLNDMDGVTRPQGTGYDIGAYEAYSGAPTTPALPPPILISVTPIP